MLPKMVETKNYAEIPQKLDPQEFFSLVYFAFQIHRQKFVTLNWHLPQVFCAVAQFSFLLALHKRHEEICLHICCEWVPCKCGADTAGTTLIHFFADCPRRLFWKRQGLIATKRRKRKKRLLLVRQEHRQDLTLHGQLLTQSQLVFSQMETQESQ